MGSFQISRGTTNNSGLIGFVTYAYSASGNGDLAAPLKVYDKPNVSSSQAYALQLKSSTGSTVYWGLGGWLIDIEEIMG